MFETSQDILNLVLAISIGAVALFLCVLMFYFIAILRRTNKVFQEIREKLHNLFDTVETGFGYLGVISEVVKFGVEHFIGKKIVEEAAEVWMASEYETKNECAEEISQLIYHLQVMMIACDMELDDIYKYL